MRTLPTGPPSVPSMTGPDVIHRRAAVGRVRRARHRRRRRPRPARGRGDRLRAGDDDHRRGRRAAAAVGPRVHAGRQHGLHREGRADQHPLQHLGPAARHARRCPGHGRGRDDGHRGRSRLRHQPADLHLLPVGRRRHARHPDRALGAERRRHRAHRPHRHPDRHPGRPRAATRVAGPASDPTATSGSARATRPRRRCPRIPSRSAARCCASTPTATGAPGNPGGPFRPEIYTYGHRNVQGIAFSPSGRAYSIEHGTSRDDEVNRLYAGANYGWDPVNPVNGSYDESSADDRPGEVPRRHPCGLVVGLPDDRPLRRHVPRRHQVGQLEPCARGRCAQGPAAACVQAGSRRAEADGRLGLGHRPGPAPGGRPGSRRQPLRRDRRQPGQILRITPT